MKFTSFEDYFRNHGEGDLLSCPCCGSLRVEVHKPSICHKALAIRVHCRDCCAEFDLEFALVNVRIQTLLPLGHPEVKKEKDE